MPLPPRIDRFTSSGFTVKGFRVHGREWRFQCSAFSVQRRRGEGRGQEKDFRWKISDYRFQIADRGDVPRPRAI
jgi:hypothetical protein